MKLDLLQHFLSPSADRSPSCSYRARKDHRHLDTEPLKLQYIVDQHVRAVMDYCHGNKLQAARVLGVSRSTLYRMLDALSPPLP